MARLADSPRLVDQLGRWGRARRCPACCDGALAAAGSAAGRGRTGGTAPGGRSRGRPGCAPAGGWSAAAGPASAASCGQARSCRRRRPSSPASEGPLDATARRPSAAGLGPRAFGGLLLIGLVTSVASCAGRARSADRHCFPYDGILGRACGVDRSRDLLDFGHR